jgi:PAS domain S-box-containing protein
LYRSMQSSSGASEAAASQLSDTELRDIVDIVPVFLARYRPDGAVDFVNRTWREYTSLSDGGAEAGESEVTHPEDRSRLVQEWRAHVQSGAAFKTEQRLRRHDGEYRWHSIYCEPLYDNSGSLVAWYGAGYDIEDRKQTEYALQRSETYSAEAQKVSMTGSVAWHVESDDHFWSDETYQIMGFERSVKPNIEMIVDRVHPDDRARLRHEIERVRQGAENLDIEQRLMMPDGKIKHVRLRARRAKYESGREEIIGALMDVTEAKRSQEALDVARTALAHANRMATLGEINATIAHEINQPLASIIANAETCLRRLAHPAPDLDKVRGNMEWVARDAKRAADVIHSVRGLVRKVDVHKIALDLNEVIDETKALLDRELTAQHVTLRLSLGRDIPQVMGDRVQIQQVVINLIMNAVEAMQVVSVRPPVLLVSSFYEEHRGVTVSVKDNGVGILDETRSRVFDPFFSTKPGGLGIGLSICRSIVEDHDGRLSASNNGGEPGSTFEFTLAPIRSSLT